MYRIITHIHYGMITRGFFKDIMFYVPSWHKYAQCPSIVKMSWIFGSRKTPQELLRENQRLITRSVRELDREKTKLEQQEKKIVVDIKKAAKAGQINACKVMAKDLVRTRKYIQKFYQMKAQLQAVGLRIQTMRSNQAMADAMKGVTKAMKQLNSKFNLPEIQKIMMEFEKQSEMMDMKEEMMNDAIDDAMDDADDEEETDQIVNQVLEEIGINLETTIGIAPTTPPVKAKNEAQENDLDAQLQARLENLRRE